MFLAVARFCTISAHQGKFVVCRSKESILNEVKKSGTDARLQGVSFRPWRTLCKYVWHGGEKQKKHAKCANALRVLTLRYAQTSTPTTLNSPKYIVLLMHCPR